MDLVYRHKMGLMDALRGQSFVLNHLSGKSFRVGGSGQPVNPGGRSTVRNMGMKRGKDTGALIIEYEVEFPRQITPSQISAIERVLEGHEPSSRSA